MKKLIILMSLALSFTSAAAIEITSKTWYFAAMSTDNTSIYWINLGRLAVVDGKRRAWVGLVNDQDKRFDTVVRLREFDCKREKVCDLDTDVYRKGKFVKHFDATGKCLYPAPNTIEEQLFDTVCKKEGKIEEELVTTFEDISDMTRMSMMIFDEARSYKK